MHTPAARCMWCARVWFMYVSLSPLSVERPMGSHNSRHFERNQHNLRSYVYFIYLASTKLVALIVRIAIRAFPECRAHRWTAEKSIRAHFRRPHSIFNTHVRTLNRPCCLSLHRARANCHPLASSLSRPMRALFLLLALTLTATSAAVPATEVTHAHAHAHSVHQAS